MKTVKRYERLRSTLLEVPRDPETLPCVVDPDAFNLIQGDAVNVLKTLPDESVDMCCTSPPYYGLRDYGVDGQIGLEDSVEHYVSKLVAVFHELQRVLKSSGALWLNISDTYSNGQIGRNDSGDNCGVAFHHTSPGYGGPTAPRKIWKQPIGSPGTDAYHSFRRSSKLPAKSLIGVPWRLAFALQADGWILRNEAVWEKPSVTPESMPDRLTRSHEKIFFFVKSKKYYYNWDAVKQLSKYPTDNHKAGKQWQPTELISGVREGVKFYPYRNMRDVWTISRKPYKGAHFATFPIEIPETCIKATCPEGGTCVDVFNGAGTTGLAAVLLGRRYIGIELNPEYVELSRRRLTETLTKLLVSTSVNGVASALTTAYNPSMTTLETFQQYEATKAAVSKLQSELEAAMTKLEDLKTALRSELGIEAAPATTRRAKGKRAPRSLESILLTACGRKMNEAKEAGTKKAAALTAAMEQAETIASGRNEKLTDELKAALTKRAEEIFGKK